MSSVASPPLPTQIARDARGGGGKVRLRDSGRPNGPEVNPRGQGLRGYGSAAHGLPACESRDAGRAPPCSFDFPSRLGRRAEAGPRRVLPRVRPPRLCVNCTEKIVNLRV